MGGVKQIAIGVNKMDCDVANYKQSRYDEIANEMKNMLIKVGWKKDFIEKNTPILPISGWMGDNLLKKSENMDWWKGMDVALKDETIHCDTVYHVLNDLVVCPRDPLPPPCGCRSLASTDQGRRRCARRARRAGCGQAQRRGGLLAYAHRLQSLRGQGLHRRDASPEGRLCESRRQRWVEYQRP